MSQVPAHHVCPDLQIYFNINFEEMQQMGTKDLYPTKWECFGSEKCQKSVFAEHYNITAIMTFDLLVRKSHDFITLYTNYNKILDDN